MRWNHSHTDPRRATPAGFEVPDLHVCRGCQWPFVVPHAVIDRVDHTKYLVELRCTNCDILVVEAHSRELLSALDSEVQRQTAEMELALELWQMTRELEEIDAFARALQADHLLPEDF